MSKIKILICRRVHIFMLQDKNVAIYLNMKKMRFLKSYPLHRSPIWNALTFSSSEVLTLKNFLSSLEVKKYSTWPTVMRFFVNLRLVVDGVGFEDFRFGDGEKCIGIVN